MIQQTPSFMIDLLSYVHIRIIVQEAPLDRRRQGDLAQPPSLSYASTSSPSDE